MHCCKFLGRLRYSFFQYWPTGGRDDGGEGGLEGNIWWLGHGVYITSFTPLQTISTLKKTAKCWQYLPYASPYGSTFLWQCWTGTKRLDFFPWWCWGPSRHLSPFLDVRGCIRHILHTCSPKKAQQPTCPWGQQFPSPTVGSIWCYWDMCKQQNKYKSARIHDLLRRLVSLNVLETICLRPRSADQINPVHIVFMSPCIPTISESKLINITPRVIILETHLNLQIILHWSVCKISVFDQDDWLACHVCCMITR